MEYVTEISDFRLQPSVAGRHMSKLQFALDMTDSSWAKNDASSTVPPGCCGPEKCWKSEMEEETAILCGLNSSLSGPTEV